MTSIFTRSATVLLALVLLGSVAQAQLPFLGKPFGVSVTSNIDYGDGTIDSTSSPAVADLFLDLYEPTGAGVPALKPALIFVHGGAWIIGDKATTFSGTTGPQEYAAEFAKRGYVAVSINYRMILDDPDGTGVLTTGGADITSIVALTQALISGFVTVPDLQVQNSIEAGLADTIKAIDWMVANAASLGVDPNRIAVAGFSAGAFNVAWAAHLAGAPVAAVWSNSGGMDGNESFIVSASAPPTIMFHGSADSTVPVSSSQALNARLDLIGVPNQYFEMPGAVHEYLGTRQVFASPAKAGSGAPLENHVADFLFEQLNLLPLATIGVPASSNTGLYALVLAFLSLGSALTVRRLRLRARR